MQAPYVVYSEKQLKERQQEAIDAIAGILSIPEGEVVRVLRHYKWCASPHLVCLPNPFACALLALVPISL